MFNRWSSMKISFLQFSRRIWEALSLYLLDTAAVFPVTKRLISEVDHWRVYCMKVRNEWSYTSTPLTPWCRAQRWRYLNQFLHSVAQILWREMLGRVLNMNGKLSDRKRLIVSLKFRSRDLFLWLRRNMKAAEQLAFEPKCGLADRCRRFGTIC